MTHFRNTFMGNTGFEELKRYTRSGTEFGREIVNIFNERVQLEQIYAKGLRRLGQRIQKATCSIVGSPLSSSWKTVGLEMEKEAEIHREFSGNLYEECIKPLANITESQLKPRRMCEQKVEASYKSWQDKFADHQKIKKRLHILRRENELLIDQLEGPRTQKTDRDHQKMIGKQLKSEETAHRAESEYYTSLLHLEKSRQDWEIRSFEYCDSIENMEDDRYREVCRIIQKYADDLYTMPAKMKNCCRIIDESVENLSPAKEIVVVAEKLRGPPYLSEQLLCDFYQENFNFPMNVERRRRSLNKLLECYINDYQKENCHKDGLRRMAEHRAADDIDNRLLQSIAMLNLLDVIRFKLSCTLATIDGNARPRHVLEDNIEDHTDKQGIKHTILRLKPGEDCEKLKERSEKSNRRKSKSKPTSSSSRDSPRRNSSQDSQGSHHRAKYNTVSAATNLAKLDRRASDGRAAPLSHHNHNNNRQQPATVRGGRPSLPADFRPSQPSPELYEEVTHPPPISNGSPTSPPPDHEPPPSYHDTHETSGGDDDEPVMCRCVAIYDYAATRDDELTIRDGDVIDVYAKGEDQWWRGRVGASVGLFPANYVETLTSV